MPQCFHDRRRTSIRLDGLSNCLDVFVRGAKIVKVLAPGCGKMQRMHLRRIHPRIPGEPAEQIVLDELMRCPYLPGKIARLPLRLPLRRLRRNELAARLAAGDRRQGVLLYRPSCPACMACEAIRLDVGEYRVTRTQQRVLNRGDAMLTTAVDAPTPSAEKVALYNRHKIERRLLTSDGLIDHAGYEQFLVNTCADTLEFTFHHRGALVGVAIADRAADALSAVYCFYDPAYARFSPGAYSILKQLELCRVWNLRYLYLGLYIADCRAMAYKARYLPHERLIGGEWVKFERAS